MAEPMVSIITAAYNAENTITATAQSVFAQTFTDWEWIVCDDGSDDSTPAILNAITDNRVRVIRLKENSGRPAVGRNHAVLYAQGKYVAFLDADDLWHPEKLEKQLAYLQEHAQTGAVFSLVHQFTGEPPQYDELPSDGRTEMQIDNPGDYRETLLYQNLITLSAMMLPRDVVERVGRFCEDWGCRGTEDYELWLRVSAAYAMGYVPECLVLYRQLPDGLGSGIVRMAENRWYALQANLPALELRRNQQRDVTANAMFHIGQAHLLAGDITIARQYLWKSLKGFGLHRWSKKLLLFLLSCFGRTGRNLYIRLRRDRSQAARISLKTLNSPPRGEACRH